MDLQPLPKALSGEIVNRLLRAVGFMQHAMSHASMPDVTSVDRMIALHGLDNSVEFLLRITADHLDIEAHTGKTLKSTELSALAGEVNSFLKTNYQITLPYLRDIQTLREIRNMVQHGAMDLFGDIDRFSKIVQRFFNTIFQRVFGLSPEELRRSILVENSDVRSHLQLAEKALEQDKYLASIVASRDAFEEALYLRRSRETRESWMKVNLIPALLTSPNARLFQAILEDLQLTKLGLNTDRYRRFKEYLAHVPAEFCAMQSVTVVMQRPWSRNDAQFCLTYVSDIILHWQSEAPEELYEVDRTSQQRVQINGISLPDKRLTCVGMGSKDRYTLVFDVEQEDMQKLVALREGPVYQLTTCDDEETENTTAIPVRYGGVQILSLLSNARPRFEVLLQYDICRDD